MSLHAPDADDAGPSTSRRPTGDGSLPAPETFDVVADETRQRILDALHAAPDAPLQFTVLQERANVDGSTRFNYHLQVLVGTFVHETADGYALTARGAAFVDAVSAAPPLETTTGARNGSD
jgi:hypothetical protein